MLLNVKNSCLVIVDVQEKLISLIDNHQQMVDNCVWLIRVAQRMGVPVILSEQYPSGLGSTVGAIKELCHDTPRAEKFHFSCAADPTCHALIEATHKQQVILIGIEAHVCILQTAIGLLDQNKDVFVVVDAVSARNPTDRSLAFERMRKVGVTLVSKEMVVYEWLEKAGTDEFKMINKEFLR